MIATPSKTDSKNNSSSNNKSNFEIFENNIITDYNPLKLPQQNVNIPNNLIEISKTNSQIHNAIISDNLEELEKLLKLGENPDILNRSGETPLYVSVDIENYDAMIILLEFGADCNMQKIDGNTALHLATEKKSDLYICALLSHGANPNIINKTNLQTPLHLAIINKINEYVLNKFKENNGDIYNIKDKFNKTPFDYAKNDEKYKNLLIQIFSQQNKINNNNKIKCLTEGNENNSNNSHLDYHNFISLSRKIHLTSEDNEEHKYENNNIKEDKNIINIDIEKNNINDINNCLKKHLIFTSNSKDISSEEKNKKLIKSEGSKNSNTEQNDKSNQGGINKNITNIISDKGSNYSNCTNNIINNENSSEDKNILCNNKNIDLKKINLTTSKKENVIDKIDDESLNFILSSPLEKNSACRSLNLENKISTIKSNNSNNKYQKININNIKNFNTITNNSNTNGNNSMNSYNKKKEEGISELNPLDMINQMVSSNNSNIFSELQINTNNKEDEGENTSSKNKTQEEFYNPDKLNSNEEFNNMKENISGNFSSNNNEINIDIDQNNIQNEEGEDENKENINFINSLDDSLEYSKTKSYIINETPGLLSKDKNDQNDYSDNFKINNKEDSLNMYKRNENSNTDNKKNKNNSALTNKNINEKIERYKSTTSNKSKRESEIDSENKSFNISNISKQNSQHHSENKSFNISNISKQNSQHHIQLSYHNNRQSSNTKNRTNNNITNITDNKENLQFNENDIDIDNKIITNIKEEDGYIIKEEELNKKKFPLYTAVSRQRIYKKANIIPEMMKEQKTKDCTIEDYNNYNTNYNSNCNKNSDNIIFINDNTHNYNNVYDFNTINTGILDNTNGNINQYNTLYSDNNSYKNTKDKNNYSNLFRKALKKKCLIREFNTDSFNQKNTNNKSETKYPQQLSNELITKLRDWLISCDLLCYYNLLIKNNIYDIESYISNLKNNKMNISYKDIEDLGIKKPGHIFRFILRLQMDIGILDNKICNYVMSKFNENLLTTIAVNSSVNEIKYCGMILCPGGAEFSKNLGYNDIFSFLRNKDLMEYKENFIHNGFDQIEFILIQLFSIFSFNKEILNDYMHIYNDSDKIKVIKKLYEEKRNIAKEIGINYNEKEVYNILNEQFNVNSLEEDEEKSQNICNII